MASASRPWKASMEATVTAAAPGTSSSRAYGGREAEEGQAETSVLTLITDRHESA